jgi:hypothetical protein
VRAHVTDHYATSLERLAECSDELRGGVLLGIKGRLATLREREAQGVSYVLSRENT